MDDLVVDDELAARVIDDEDTDAATTIVERIGDLLEKTALVEDGQTLLDIAGLGHGDDTAILTNVEDTVLLEDRAEHVLNHDRRGRVGDEARLLMELLGEEINTKVAVLAGLGRGGDADDLARAALKDQEIANADVVAGDGDGVGGRHGAGARGLGDVRSTSGSRFGDEGFGGRRRRSGSGHTRLGGSGVSLLDDYLFLVGGVLVLVVVRVVAVAVDRVKNAIGGFVKTVTEAVVVAFVVVISHITFVLGRVGSRPRGRRLYSNRLGVAAVDNLFGAGTVARLLFRSLGVAGLGEVSTKARLVDDRTGTLTELTLSRVKLRLGEVVGRSADGAEVAVVGALLEVLDAVGAILDVDLSFVVALEGFLIAVGWNEDVSDDQWQRRVR